MNGPIPTDDNTLLKFLAFGDTPYDEEVGPPFEGDEYVCLNSTHLPEVLANYTDKADFIAHVGDIKRGGSDNSAYCNDEVFGSRHRLFDVLEPELDFFIVPGDNEWNECDGYVEDPLVDDPAKMKWKEYFASGNFEAFDRNDLPSGATAPTVTRQTNHTQNFFFYYHEVAFVGITEPAGDSEYDPINADWITSNLSGKTLKAIVLIAHKSPPEPVEDALDAFKALPILYLTGNAHEYCSRFYNRDRYPKMLELTVAAYLAAPLLISLVESNQGEIDFHVENLPSYCEGEGEKDGNFFES